MSRQPREVYPFVPHHIVQRGCRREKTFFDETDFRTYIRFLNEAALKYIVDIWCYCLMTNHIHLIAFPHDETGLSKMIAHAHRKYSLYMNKKMNWSGHLWQYRYESEPIDEDDVLATARYIERNPVAAKMVAHPCDYQWSSANAHVTQKPDDLVLNPSLYKFVDDWKTFIEQPTAKEMKQIFEFQEKMTTKRIIQVI